MNYKETINFLFSLLPVYQNQGKTAIKKDLTNIKLLCDALGSPENSFKSIHVGGTNGKGTVSHLIASVLQESGYKVGLYTSPHYIDFRERIKINGVYISQAEVIEFVESQKNFIQKIKPSFFELTVAMAFDHFRRQKVDIAVIEVGLGGRLDSTNVITPELSVITNIGLDHMDLLGDSISSIATEKAGIIKKAIPVVIGEYHSESASVFQNKALSTESSISFASEEWKVEKREGEETHFEKGEKIYSFDISNQGPFHKQNVSTALEAFDHINMDINDLHIKEGINMFVSNTNFQGRWHWSKDQKDVLLDSGHNEHAFNKSMTFLKSMDYSKIHFVLGFVKGKDILKMLKMLPFDGKYYLAKPSIFRGANPSTYTEYFVNEEYAYETYITLYSAYLAALRSRKKGELIFIGGSSFVVGELLGVLES